MIDALYCEHALTEIEKGNLDEIANGFKANGGRTLPSYAESKDTRKISLRQANLSKILDEKECLTIGNRYSCEYP